MNLTTLGILSFALAIPAPSDKGNGAKQLDTLQGEWVLLETADQKRTDLGDDKIRMIVRGDLVTMKFGDVTTNRGSLTVGMVKKLATIDMKFDNGRSVQGIYALAGPTLTICVAEEGQGRPTSLTPAGAQWSEKWKQVRP